MFFAKAVLYFFILALLQIWNEALYLDRRNAECTVLENCPHIHELVKTKRDSYGVLTLLNLLHCPHRNRRIYLKCVDPPKVEDFMERAELIPSHNDCGLESLKPKISRGIKTNLDDHPWVALLRYEKIDGEEAYGCHGSLISRRYVLTAAHCVHPNQIQEKLYRKIVSVVLGEYDVTTDEDCVGSNCVSNQTKEVFVESVEIHPEYNTTNFVNDIALIRLDSEVEYSDFIQPVCLSPIILIPPYNQTLWIAGWGGNEDEGTNSVKVQAEFKLDKMDSCVASNLTHTSKQFCARSTNVARTCQGDSGGPLMMRIRSKEYVRFFLIGVNSLGIDCRIIARHFAIYTRVAPYVEWILTTIHK